jgi:hypothetical protein
MTPGGQDRTRTSHKAVAQPSRRPIAQRILLVMVVLCGGLLVVAVILRMRVLGLVALVITVAAGIPFLAGVKRKQRRQGWPVEIWNWLGLTRKPSDDPSEETSQPSGRTMGPPEAGQKPNLSSEKGAPPADRGWPPARNSMPGPDRRAEQPQRSPSNRVTTAALTAPVPVEREAPAVLASRLPDPPVFSSASAPGQAPWHMPVGAAPSGLAADAARLGDLEVRAASMVGAGHRCQEPAGPRQDAYALGRTPDGQFLIIAVADGVSESPRSDLGARVAVSAATRELGKMLASGGMAAINVELLYKIVSGEMLGTGRDRGLRDEDICSLLIAAVIPTVPRPDGTRPIWASWIGDVSLWIHHTGALHRVTGMEKTGLDRNTLSAVLPFNPDRAERLVFDLRLSDRIAVMTDGLSDSLSAVSGVADFFAREWAGSAPHPAAFLHSLCYDGPGQTDDRTAVVVWCGVDRLPGQAIGTGRRI